MMRSVLSHVYIYTRMSLESVSDPTIVKSWCFLLVSFIGVSRYSSINQKYHHSQRIDGCDATNILCLCYSPATGFHINLYTVEVYMSRV